MKAPISYKIQYTPAVTKHKTALGKTSEVALRPMVTVSYNNKLKHSNYLSLRKAESRADVNKWNDELADGIIHPEIELIQFVLDQLIHYPEDFKKTEATIWINFLRLPLSEVVLGAVLYSLFQYMDSVIQDADRQKDEGGSLEDYFSYHFILKLESVFSLPSKIKTFHKYNRRDNKRYFVFEHPRLYFESLFGAVKQWTDEDSSVFKEIIDDNPHFLQSLELLEKYQSPLEPYDYSLYSLMKGGESRKRFDSWAQSATTDFDLSKELWTGAVNHSLFRKSSFSSKSNQYFKHYIIQQMLP